MDLGASELVTFRKVTLPLMASAMLAAEVNVVPSAIFLVAIALGLGNVLWQYRSAKRTQGAP